MSQPLPWISQRLLDLRTCVCDSLRDYGAGPTCWCGIWPGAEVSWEYCGDCSGQTCGMGWVRLVSMFGSSLFPEADNSPTCRAPLAYAVEVGALRCVPVAEEDGSLPDEGALLTPSFALVDDALALRRAIECCFGERLHVLSEWAPAGPSGGCVGGSWLVTVAP